MTDLAAYIARQAAWSAATFGPGPRTVGLCRHIQSELAEIQADPSDLTEWVDVIILALDGAWRAGHSPSAIVAALEAKQAVNLAREWPPPGPQDEPTEHVRGVT